MATTPKSRTTFRRDPDLPFLESRDSRIAGSPFAAHTHETYAVSVVEEGSTLLGCRGGKWLMDPGSAVFLPPGEPHACNPRPGQTLKYRKFYLEREWFERRLQEAGECALDPAVPAILDDGDTARAFLRVGMAQDEGAPG